MTIDLERLAVDLDYWDEVAPEGASHLIDDFTFTKWEYGEEFSWDIRHDTAWVADDPIYPLSKYLKECYRWKVLAKPTKPAAPKTHPTDTQDEESGAQISAEWEWENCLPPVGLEIEINAFGRDWIRAKVTAYGEKELLYKISEPQIDSDGDLISGELPANKQRAQFRPIRSQADRDREDLAELLGNCVKMRTTFGEMADVIIAAGYCKEGLA
jgi:hypothetical protein